MQIMLKVVVEVQHASGPFVGKDDVAEEFRSGVEAAIGDLIIVEDTKYQIDSVGVEVAE